MDNLPVDPQLIIFAVMALIGITQTLFKKKDKTDPHAPIPHEEDPFQELKRMMEASRRESERQRREQEQEDAPPSPEPAPTLVTHPAEPPREQETPPVVITPSYPAPTPVPSPHEAWEPRTPEQPTLEHEELLDQSPPPLPVTQAPQVQRRVAPAVDLKRALSRPDSTRQAILLSEILGKPKGL